MNCYYDNIVLMENTTFKIKKNTIKYIRNMSIVSIFTWRLFAPKFGFTRQWNIKGELRHTNERLV